MTETCQFLTAELDHSAYGDHGYYDGKSHYQFIFPKSQRRIDPAYNMLVIGAVGTDSIEFVIKPHDRTIYAHYPIEQEFRKLAPNFTVFIDGWIAGTIFA